LIPISSRFRRALDDRGGDVAGHAAQVEQALVLLRADLADDRLHAHEELVFDPLERLLVVHAPGGLAEVADDEAHRVGHDQRELTEDPRGHELEEDRVFHRLEGPPKGDAPHRLHLHEEDLGDEDVPTGKRGDQAVQKGDVLRLEGVPARREVALVLPVLKNSAHSSLSTVSCEYMGTFWSGCL